MSVPVSYPRPSYLDLLSRIEADLSAVPASLRGPLSAAWAMVGHGQHGFLEWIDAQCSPLSCELERLYDWAALYRVDRLSATAARGVVLASGTAGVQVLAGVELRGVNGLDYVVREAVTLGAGATSVPVLCTTPGAAGNLAMGQVLSLVDPVPGCAGSLSVAAGGLSGGAEDESVEDWRARVCDEWQTVVSRGGRAGKPEDYVFWAKSAHPSVSGALVQPHVLGVGTVVVRPFCDALPDRLPTQAVMDAVSAFLLSVAPATADWRVVAPVVRPVAVSLHLLAPNDTAEVRGAIGAALAEWVMGKRSDAAVLALGEVDAAVATVTSLYSRVAPVADVEAGAGEVLVLSAVSFV